MDETRTGAAARGGEGHGIDLDPARRPGVPRMHDPRPLPNALYPPEHQRSDATVFMHGRPHKTFPPVFGTSVPPAGVSGRVRRAAYRYPDHHMRHWTMLLLADRIDVWEHRALRLLRVAAPALGALALAGGLRALRLRRSWAAT